MDKRYNELKKENNLKIEQLSDSYQRIAKAYVGKGRGYAEKSLDTEAHIKDVLDELTELDTKGIGVNLAIPNMTEYVENHIKILAKARTNVNKIKSIVSTAVFLVIILGMIGFGLYLRSSNYLDTPTNLKVDKVSNNEIRLSWDEVPGASSGYTVWYDNADKIEVEGTTYIFNLNPDRTYTFYVYANAITTTSGENMIYLYYQSSDAKIEYKPS